MNPARKFAAIALLFVAFSGGALFLYLALFGTRAEPNVATVLPMTVELPAFSLIDDQGQPFTRDSLRGRTSVLFFGFTNCPDICPATLQQLAIARQRLAGESVAFPDIILISVDPERDSPEVLADYVRHFGAEVRGLTGNLETISALTRPLGIYFAKSGDLEGDYSVDHSAVVLVINENAEWFALFSAPHTVDGFVHDLPLLVGGG